MTLTELKYIVALARERHFGRAAEACFVSQPTLSVAIKKFEDELDVMLFERGLAEVGLTAIGERIVEQAQRVLEQACLVKEIARQGSNPLLGPLRVGVIYTIGPYLLPSLVQKMISRYEGMPLIIQENFTVKLLELLKQGELDVAILALPVSESAISIWPIYEEPFYVAIPAKHPWAKRKSIAASELKSQTMLLLGVGHCFRDQVLDVCPELARFSQASEGIQRTFEGSSLETIRHMVASGVGITLLPSSSVPSVVSKDSLLRYIALEEPADRRQVALVWRKSFSRLPAIDALRNAILACRLYGCVMLNDIKVQ